MSLPANRTLCIGDNLEHLRQLPDGCVDLVITDPPFNTGRRQVAGAESGLAGYSYDDRWRDAQLTVQGTGHSKVDAVVNALRLVDGDDTANYADWLAPRLLEIHRVLKDMGSLYVHIDNAALHTVRMLLNAVFGRQRFRDVIVWSRSGENLSQGKWRRSYEVLVYYVKGQSWTWHTQTRPHTPEYLRSFYAQTDEHGPYRLNSCTNSADRPNMVYEWNGHVRQWRFVRETMEGFEREGLLVYNERGIPRRKSYLADHPEVPLGNVWSDIPVLASGSRERTGYPTQKPAALYERAIAASSNPGDLILDPFCGSGTTLIAAEKLGRRWVGMDLWSGVPALVLGRLASEGLQGGDSKWSHVVAPNSVLRG